MGPGAVGRSGLSWLQVGGEATDVADLGVSA